ncbi:MAG: CoA transferase, partial [Deltaproteobacteria bacterium]|nr:CoA transferase [Deltaproteobacteria bacterium]
MYHPGPLEGIRIIDFTHVLAGPFTTMLLGDLGAEIIKIEIPGRGDSTRQSGPPFKNGESAYFIAHNRNKKSISVKKKKPEGA